MKKTLAWVAALATACSLGAVNVCAEETEVNVFVTISDAEGKLAVAQELVSVSDLDADGALTINDAMIAAHDAFYEGGAEAGFGSAQSTWGLSMTKLWGSENGGSYGYRVNDVSSMGLADPVAEGDYVNAYVYTDLSTWSDKYSYFDTKNATLDEKEEITLTLVSAGYDASYNEVTSPVAGAVITVDGVATEYVTDENGTVTLSFETEGARVISAVSDSVILVPPVCTVSVLGGEPDIIAPAETDAPVETTEAETTTEEATTEAATTTTAAATTAASTTAAAATTTSNPKTGEAGMAVAFAGISTALIAAYLTSRKNEE